MKHFILFAILILSVILIVNYDPIFASHGGHHDESMGQHGMKDNRGTPWRSLGAMAIAGGVAKADHVLAIVCDHGQQVGELP